jgi:hypothetical protein
LNRVNLTTMNASVSVDTHHSATREYYAPIGNGNAFHEVIIHGRARATLLPGGFTSIKTLFGEGIYHGKAIYDVRAFHKILGGRFRSSGC